MAYSSPAVSSSSGKAVPPQADTSSTTSGAAPSSSFVLQGQRVFMWDFIISALHCPFCLFTPQRVVDFYLQGDRVSHSQSFDHMHILVECVGAMIFVHAVVLLALSLEPVCPSKHTMGAMAVSHLCLLLLFTKHWVTGVYKDLSLCQVLLACFLNMTRELTCVAHSTGHTNSAHACTVSTGPRIRRGHLDSRV
jgi:hypothetical protein